MSKKRILPALILAGSVGFLGVHRFYAGRHITGLIQLVLFAAGIAMFSHDLSGISSLQTLDQVQDWAERHPIHPLPVLLVSIPSLWALLDCLLLMLRRFRDGSGEVMTRWV